MPGTEISYTTIRVLHLSFTHHLLTYATLKIKLRLQLSIPSAVLRELLEPRDAQHAVSVVHGDSACLAWLATNGEVNVPGQTCSAGYGDVGQGCSGVVCAVQACGQGVGGVGELGCVSVP